jgi:hypothetical protein
LFFIFAGARAHGKTRRGRAPHGSIFATDTAIVSVPSVAKVSGPARAAERTTDSRGLSVTPATKLSDAVTMGSNRLPAAGSHTLPGSSGIIARDKEPISAGGKFGKRHTA